MVNGRAWPVVSVKRQAYWFVLHNAAQIRSFNLTLRNDTSGSDLNLEPGAFWVVGGDGGLR
jgi:hypothetical protein